MGTGVLYSWNWMYTINPAPFDYVRVSSIKEAVELLSKYGEDAKIIAGGQSLLLLMRKRLVKPKVLIDINFIPNLNYIEVKDNYLVIGALTTFSDILTSQTITNECPLVRDASLTVGDVQVRNRATIGGNLVEAAPGANLLPVLLATDAEIVVTGPTGEKVYTAANFFTGPYASAIGKDEVLTEVRIPVGKFDNYVHSYVKVARRVQEFGILTVAALIKLSNDGVVKDARIALGNAARVPVRAKAAEEALIDKRLSKDVIENVSKVADSGIDVRSTAAASADYRRQLIRVYVKRVLMDVARKAGVM